MASEGKHVRFFARLVLAGISVITALTSYQHCLDVVEGHGTTDWTRFSIPAVADLLVLSASLSMYDSTKRDLPRSRWAVSGMFAGVLVTGAMNVSSGWEHGWWGRAIAAWVPLALFIAYEILMSTLRKAVATQSAPLESVCMHTVGGSVEEDIKIAFLHGRDCLGKEPSVQGLADAYKTPKPAVQMIVNRVKQQAVAKATVEV